MARVDADERRVDHVCRLARAQWARGKAFFIQAPDQDSSLAPLAKVPYSPQCRRLPGGGPGRSGLGPDTGPGRRPGDGEEELGEHNSAPSVREPSAKEREAIQKLHQHPNAASLARTLRIGGAPEHLWKWVKRFFIVLLAAPEFFRNRLGRLLYQITLRMWWWR